MDYWDESFLADSCRLLCLEGILLDAAIALISDFRRRTVTDTLTYAPFGPLTGLIFGNGLVLSRTLDQQYRLTDQTTGTIQDIDFTLDAAGSVCDHGLGEHLAEPGVQPGCAQPRGLV
jgi:hypothetical protein